MFHLNIEIQATESHRTHHSWMRSDSLNAIATATKREHHAAQDVAVDLELKVNVCYSRLYTSKHRGSVPLCVTCATMSRRLRGRTKYAASSDHLFVPYAQTPRPNGAAYSVPRLEARPVTPNAPRGTTDKGLPKSTLPPEQTLVLLL